MARTLNTLIKNVREIILSARKMAAQSIDTTQVIANFYIGRLIFEHEQKGKKRADYGASLLRDLSDKLTVEFGRGFSKRNLKLMRCFYLEYRNSAPKIAQTLSA